MELLLLHLISFGMLCFHFCLSHLISFGMLCFHFCLSQDIFYLSLSTSSVTRLFRSVLFSLHIFVNFPCFVLLLISSFIPLWWEKIHNRISINFLKFVNLFCGLTYYLSWRMFHVHLRRMCILLLACKVCVEKSADSLMGGSLVCDELLFFLCFQDSVFIFDSFITMCLSEVFFRLNLIRDF